MKYKSQKYITENLDKHPISLSTDSVFRSLRIAKKESGILLNQLSDTMGLDDTIHTIKSFSRKCKQSTDPLEKLYCQKEECINILRGLHSLAMDACNDSRNKNICKTKVYNSSIEIQNKLIRIINKIKQMELNIEDVKNASEKDLGVMYDNEYERQDI